MGEATPKPTTARILIADDEQPVRAALARVLRGAGHDVVAVEDGAQALESFGKAPPDLIVSDVMMPNLDGLGLLKAVREQNEDLPFILLTGAPTMDSAISAVRYHATEYLPKPVAPDEMLAAVSHAIRLNQLASVRREALALYEKRIVASAGSPQELTRSFDRALEALFMVYQPIVDWQGRQVFGYEALVRSSETSLPHPGALFDAAETLHRLTDLGRAIRNKCGGPMHLAEPDVSLFVNLHTQDLLDETLFDAASELTKIAPRVILEITERAHIEKVQDVQRRVSRLRALGFRIAIDDIGAGYSGLNSFAVVQPDVVKLDITLVRGIDADPIKKKLVSALFELCTDLGIT
ncbi:MAG TPA: EAL domain-containing protein, partial [Polyangiales bacterium]|nr:EAL domain-containing protein [Polyangiales bacterium]